MPPFDRGNNIFDQIVYRFNYMLAHFTYFGQEYQQSLGNLAYLDPQSKAS